jgi:diguanylate cyclase (GGDEF)-like protein
VIVSCLKCLPAPMRWEAVVRAVRRAGARLSSLRLWAGLTLACLCGPAVADDAAPGSTLGLDVPRLLFERVGDDQQLRDGVITGLAQDASGFLWIGTTEGLVRYDGYRFKAYRHVLDDSTSLPGNRIERLFADRRGRLWVGTYADGAAVYDPTRDHFVPVRPPRDSIRLPRVPGPTPVRAFAETAEGVLWIGTSGQGLWRVGVDGDVRHFDASDEWFGLPDDRISALAVDAEQGLWIGSWAGLSRLRAGAERVERVLSEPGEPGSFHNVPVRGIHAASDGSIWVGSQDGRLTRLPPEAAREVGSLDPAGVRSWGRMSLNAAIESPDGRLWVAHSLGLELFEPDGRHLGSYSHRRGEPFGLTDMGIRELTIDRSGWLWLGSFGGGLMRAYPGERAIQSRRLDAQRDAPLERLSLSSLAAAPDGGLWAAVDAYGMVRMDSDFQIREHIRLSEPDGGPSLGLQLTGSALDPDGVLWIGTELGLYRRAPGEARPIRVSAPEFIEGKMIRRLWPGANGELWIGTGDGLFLRDAEGRVQRLAAADGARVGGAINALQFDASGAWLGGASGLFRVDLDRRVLHPVSTEIDGRPSSVDVLGLVLDRGGRLWVDAAGLMRLENFDGLHARLHSISGRHGFGGVAFGANLLDDARGRIWSQRFMYDPAADRLFPLGPREGALAGSGWFRSYARLADGRLAFGMNQGLLVIDSQRFDEVEEVAPLAVTGLRIDGVEQTFGSQGAEVLLQPQDRAFAIEFAALDFTAPNLQRYRYRLLGSDDAWIEVGPEARVASFGGLFPGDYRLQVQASSRTGQYGEAMLELPVKVLPKWWQRPLVLAGLAVLFSFLVEAMVRLRRRRLLRLRQQLQFEVEQRSNELKRLQEALDSCARQVEESSLSDPLTGLRSRRFGEQELPKEAALYQRRPPALGVSSGRQTGSLVLFLLDVDQFKRLNADYGHAAGDEVLRQIAARLRETCRSSDHILRWGGDEFLIAARDTDRYVAVGLAERIRARIADHPFDLEDGRAVSLTVTMGLVPFPLLGRAPMAAGWEDAVDLADRLLMAGKHAGRNAWIALFAERDAGAPERCLEWADVRRIEAGDVRIESNLPLARIVQALDQRS